MGTWNNVKLIVWMFAVGGAWAFISSMAVYGWNPWSMDSSAWQGVAVAVLTQCGTVATLYLTPWVRQFGLGSK